MMVITQKITSLAFEIHDGKLSACSSVRLVGCSKFVFSFVSVSRNGSQRGTSDSRTENPRHQVRLCRDSNILLKVSEQDCALNCVCVCVCARACVCVCSGGCPVCWSTSATTVTSWGFWPDPPAPTTTTSPSSRETPVAIETRRLTGSPTASWGRANPRQMYDTRPQSLIRWWPGSGNPDLISAEKNWKHHQSVKFACYPASPGPLPVQTLAPSLVLDNKLCG